MTQSRVIRYRRTADRAWRFLAKVTFVLALTAPVGFLLGFRMIITSSVPKGLWFVHGGALSRGDYALVCLPVDLARAGIRAGYLAPGFCPGRALPLMKKVVALAGDSVRVSRDGVEVNGLLIDGSRPLRRDSRGRAIPGHVSREKETVPNGIIWVLGDWFKSWDSRYYGGIERSRVIGVGLPLITTPAGS